MNGTSHVQTPAHQKSAQFDIPRRHLLFRRIEIRRWRRMLRRVSSASDKDKTALSCTYAEVVFLIVSLLGVLLAELTILVSVI